LIVYLPPNDRRHFVQWCDLTEKDFTEQYWKDLWGFYEQGGYGHVAAYLNQVELSKWNAKAPPLKTEAFWAIVNAQRPPEDSRMTDILEKLDNPAAVLLRQIIYTAGADGFGEFGEWLQEHKNRRIIPKIMDRCNYDAVRNPNANDGRWKVEGRWETAYAKKGMTLNAQLAAVHALIETLEKQAADQAARGNVTAFRPKREE
jgi:hypothetical protein